jgi:hypothetical protein
LKAQASQARRGGHLVIIIIIITTRLSLPPPSFPALTARSSLRYFIFKISTSHLPPWRSFQTWTSGLVNRWFNGASFTQTWM